MAEKLRINGTLVRSRNMSGYVEELLRKSDSDFESACFLKAYRVALSDEEDGLEKQIVAAAFFVYPDEQKEHTIRYHTAVLMRKDQAGGYHYLNAGAAYWKNGQIVTCRFPLPAVTKMVLQAEIVMVEYRGDAQKRYSLGKTLKLDDMEKAQLRKAGFTVK